MMEQQMKEQEEKVAALTKELEVAMKGPKTVETGAKSAPETAVKSAPETAVKSAHETSTKATESTPKTTVKTLSKTGAKTLAKTAKSDDSSSDSSSDSEVETRKTALQGGERLQQRLERGGVVVYSFEVFVNKETTTPLHPHPPEEEAITPK